MKSCFKVIFVAGARPNFMKLAPLVSEFKKYPAVQPIIVHTGQHYDKKMSQVFFEELNIPKPDINLEVGSGSHSRQTGEILIRFDAVLETIKPDLVVVVGDVNSTIACSLAAKKRGIRVAHVEAGLRSFDWTMPEEINRVLTDRLSDFLFCTEPSASKNLKAEGIHAKKIFLVGNVMIDTLKKSKVKSQKSKVFKKLNLTGEKFVIVTLHRPGNVDDENSLSKIIKILKKIAESDIRIIFPVHPRTKKNIEKWRINTQKLLLIEPLGYFDFLKLINHADIVLTDSGGIQEETTALGIPCLTLRKNTERPITVEKGTNQIVGTDEKKILATVKIIMQNSARKIPKIRLWDGKAAKRITKIIIKKLKLKMQNCNSKFKT